MTDLVQIIGDLIAIGKEGDHWDFKLEQHTKAGATKSEKRVCSE